MSTRPLGTIWVARATLYNSAGRVVGYCTDTPNAIARAMMEHHEVTGVKGYLETVARDRTEYRGRMNPGNQCPSGYMAKGARA